MKEETGSVNRKKFKKEQTILRDKGKNTLTETRTILMSLLVAWTWLSRKKYCNRNKDHFDEFIIGRDMAE